MPINKKYMNLWHLSCILSVPVYNFDAVIICHTDTYKKKAIS